MVSVMDLSILPDLLCKSYHFLPSNTIPKNVIIQTPIRRIAKNSDLRSCVYLAK